ncbi:hypothetical protein [Tissierella praeacuta]|uniref:hypothetical protein n=1 Tax=Tissierella praeacuta TaxID=43131 RepID=UPI0010447DC7|nr:hypothetical protein [Tissierella praeacuta]MBU5255311.1 hypothetical protein [Tissierella praeacuta]TCU67821.1 hypothetical protein EV204_11165 [Tissierella praeacuta]
MKRMLILCITLCLLLTGITGTALADSGIEVKLENLEKQKENNLISIKEQLTQQDMMAHYYIYEEIIEEEYNALKRKVENEYGHKSLYRADDKVRLRNGGQISYKMGENITNDPRGHAFLVSDYYTKRQTKDIIRKYDRNNRITWKDLSRFVIETVISEKSKIPYIGPLLIGIEGTKLVRDYITVKQIEAVENSRTGCMIIASSSTTVGRSTTIRVWEDTPYAYIPTTATRVKIKHF